MFGNRNECAKINIGTYTRNKNLVMAVNALSHTRTRVRLYLLCIIFCQRE